MGRTAWFRRSAVAVAMAATVATMAVSPAAASAGARSAPAWSPPWATVKMVGHPASGKDATDEFKLTVQMP